MKKSNSNINDSLSLANRTSFFDAFMPPDGHRLTHAIVSTYSLDFDVAFALLCSMMGSLRNVNETHFPPEPGPDGSRTEDAASNPALFDWRKALIVHLRRIEHRVAFLYESGRLQGEWRSNIQRLLRAFLYPVNPQQGSSFHPKWSLLRFKDDAAHIRYRIICSSRNMSRAPMLELLACLEGDVDNTSRRLHKQNQNICSFLNALGKIKTDPQLPPHLLATLQKEIPHTNFKIGEGFENDWEFSFGGNGIPLPDPLTHLGHVKNALVVSPFVDQKQISRFAETLKKKHRRPGSRRSGTKHATIPLTLICRPEEAFKVKDIPSLALNTYVFTPNSDITDATMSHRIGDLHAKLYCFEDEKGTHLWIGSANATNRAWHGRNTEAMLHVRTRDRGVIEKFKENLKERIRKPDIMQEPDANDLACMHLIDMLRPLRLMGNWNEQEKLLTIQVNAIRLNVSKKFRSYLAGKLEILIVLLEDEKKTGTIQVEVGEHIDIPAGKLEIREVLTNPSGFVRCLVMSPDGSPRGKFLIQLEMDVPPLSYLLDQCREDLKPGDLGYLLWSFVGETIEGATRNAKRGAQSNGNPSTPVRNQIAADGLPDFEDILHACVAPPDRISELEALADAMQENPYRIMLHTLINSLKSRP